MRSILFPLAAIAMLAGCASTPATRAAAARDAADDEAGLRKELAGLVTDGKGSCLSTIDLRNSYSTKAYGPALVYRVSPRVKYVSTTTGGCERIARGDVLVTISQAGELCRGDIAHTVDPVARFQTGSCSFGDFLRYQRPS